MMYEKEFGPLVAGIDISGDPRQQDITLLLPKLTKLKGTLLDYFYVVVEDNLILT